MRYPLKLSVFAALSACSGAVAQNWEADLGYVASDDDQVDQRYDVALARYFQPLDPTSRYPLEEIAFGERIARVKVSLARQSLSSEIIPGTSSEVIDHDSDGDANEFAIEYRHRSSASNHSWMARVSRDESDTRQETTTFSEFLGEFRSQSESDSEALSLRIGYDYYVSDAWTVGAFFERVDTDTDFASSSYRASNRTSRIDFEASTTTNLFGLGTERLFDLGGGRWAQASAEVAYQETDIDSESVSENVSFWQFWDGEVWEVGPGSTTTESSRTRASHDAFSFRLGGKFYFNKRTSLSAGFQYIDEPVDTYAYSIGITHFFTDALFVRIEAARAEIDLDFDLGEGEFMDVEFDDTSDSVLARIGFRF